jgi:hypothetical protein
MMEAVRTSETSVDNHFTRQYIPEDNSEQYLQSLGAASLITACLITECYIFATIQLSVVLELPMVIVSGL